MKIHEVAKMTGITVRTLHYYDEIGLLKPDRITQAGYRIYDRESLETLQQILFFRELDFPLTEIREIMKNPGYDKKEALYRHRELLVKKRQRLDGLVRLVDDAIEGGMAMSFQEFDTAEIEKMKRKYTKEVKERWGHTEAYTEFEQKTGNLNEKQWKTLKGQGDEILREFGENRHLAADSETAQQLVEKWQNYITENYYYCTLEILSGLGQMYICDERFRNNINRYGEGTAEFMAKAIEKYCVM